MRPCKVVTWILILSIVNFALGAPAAVRERLEMLADVDVAERETATSRKRYDPLDDSSTTNTADRPPTPPMRSQSEIDRLWEDVERESYYNDRYSPPTPDSGKSSESIHSNSDSESHPGPTSGFNPGPPEHHFPSPPGQSNTLTSAGHQPAVPQSSAGGSPLPPIPHPGSPEGRIAGPLGWQEDLDTLSSTGHQPTPPHSPAGGSPLLHQVNPYRSPSTGQQLTPPHSPTGGSPLHPLMIPGSSEDRIPSPPGWPGDPDTLSSTGHQPTLPQSPGEQDLHSLLSPEAFPTEFWDDFLKGIIKPRNARISGPDAVHLARTDPRSRIF